MVDVTLEWDVDELPPTSSTKGSPSLRLGLGVGIGLGLALALGVLLGTLLLSWRRKKGQSHGTSLHTSSRKGRDVEAAGQQDPAAATPQQHQEHQGTGSPRGSRQEARGTGGALRPLGNLGIKLASVHVDMEACVSTGLASGSNPMGQNSPRPCSAVSRASGAEGQPDTPGASSSGQPTCTGTCTAPASSTAAGSHGTGMAVGGIQEVDLLQAQQLLGEGQHASAEVSGGWG